ncbi:hypothetical protein EJ06DRAFT_566892 [Trichodelitschia bisporula]|uniref:Uncharacterized protein n=1 Tax=Trichodelitschia bisporula TaxID=703511 RepID=A0A6G1HML9_9PEZI|nr:hypothetical protein EJ06DRAFT_566892 [Trichodelitschia bisporula]
MPTTASLCSSQLGAEVCGEGAARLPAGAKSIPAQAAWDCIQSVPLNRTAALELLTAVRPYVRWQSTTAVLKNPPAEYVAKVQEPVDIWGGLDNIEKKLKAGEWTREYDFGWELYHLFQSAHDGHFYYLPDVVAGIFSWGRPLELVSVSEDGFKIPGIFVFADVLTAAKDTTFHPSAVSQINGQDAAAFLQDWSQISGLQDRDALYNVNFYNLAQVRQGGAGSATGLFSGGNYARWTYPGGKTTITYANGTTVTYENYARVLQSFANIKSGQDLYDKYFKTAGAMQNMVAKKTASASSPGYPEPVVVDSSNLISGYFLDGEHSEVAVLTVASFEPSIDEFQSVTEKFLAEAKKAGKKKLVIDVSGNGGGYIVLAYELFKQLFPQTEAYAAADRLRASNEVQMIGEVYSATGSDSPFNYKQDLQVDGKHFKNWPEKFGPVQSHGDNFTQLIRWDWTDPNVLSGITMTGYGTRTEFKQPFAAEDIVIVYDGHCASSCTIFSELMRQLVGVKTVVMGGRPNKNMIQAVGGVKGTNAWSWLGNIRNMVQESVAMATADQSKKMKNSELDQYNSDLPFQRSVASGVNNRDGIRKGDSTGTPLQFVYEPADCRLFYTLQMTVDATAMWKAAADAKWNGKECVAGNLGSIKRRSEQTSSGTTQKVAFQNTLSTEVVDALEKSRDLESEVFVFFGADSKALH